MATWEQHEHGVPAFQKKVLVGQVDSDGNLTRIWDADKTYSTGDIVIQDGVYYESLSDDNTAEPATDGGTSWDDTITSADVSRTDFLEIIPATDANINLNTELLDDTDLTVNDARTNIAGLREWSVDLTLNYKPDNEAYVVIRDSFLSRDNLWVVYVPNHPDETALADTDSGYIGRVAIENFDHSGGVGDLETVDSTLQSASSIYWTTIEDIPIPTE